MIKINKRNILKIIITITYASMMSVVSCTPKEKNELIHDHAHEHEDHDHEDHNHGNNEEIVLEPEQAERMGVKTAIVNSGVFTDAIQVTGKISTHTPNIATVSAPTPGIFTFAPNVSEGVRVVKGQLIGTIKASDVAGGDINLADKTTLENAKRELDRLDTLYQQQLITADKYYAALADYEIAKVRYSPVAATGQVFATGSGIITQVLVGQGKYVEAGSEIAQISDGSMLTLTAEIPDRYASMIPQITSARIIPYAGATPIDLSSLGGKKLVSASDITNSPGYRPVVFTFIKDSRLIPGSVVEVYLLGAKRGHVLSIPIHAITEQQGQYFVYVKIDDEGYIKTPVTLGDQDGKSVEVLSGLHVGDVIVVEGTTALRLAETSGVVPEGHSHSH